MPKKKKKMREIVLSKFQVTRHTSDFPYTRTQAWAIAFVYTPSDSFVVKGMHDAVENYVKSHFRKYVMRLTFWKNGANRGLWYASDGIRINSNFEEPRRKRYEISVNNNIGMPIFTKTVRRVPRKWLDIYEMAGQSTRR